MKALQILLVLMILTGCTREEKPTSNKRYIIKIWEGDKVVRTYQNVYRYKVFKDQQFKRIDFVGDGFQGEERQVAYTIEEQTDEIPLHLYNK